MNIHQSEYHLTDSVLWREWYCTARDQSFDLSEAGAVRRCRLSVNPHDGVARIGTIEQKLVTRSGVKVR